MKVVAHYNPVDWCHLCGRRHYPLADIWFPENAEGDQRNTRYIRICTDCAKVIHGVASGRIVSDRLPAKSIREQSLEARLDPQR